MSALELPPWGIMETALLERVRKRPIPEAWRPVDGMERASEWRAWREKLIGDIADLFWPVYDRERRQWSKPPDIELIKADFALLHTLQPYLYEFVRGIAETQTCHLTFFREEDDEDIIFGHAYERYDPTLPEYLRRELTDILWVGCDRKLGSLHYDLKSVFQRPRAYQVAMLLELPHQFTPLWGKLASHPSLVSGHCLQGVLGGCSAYQLFGSGLDRVSLEVLQQFTVDIGDRRVFAGVHYPSDNLSSWYTAFKLLPHVIDSNSLAGTRKFLWEAISTKSVVYEAVARHVRESASSPYAKCVTALVAAATGKQP